MHLGPETILLLLGPVFVLCVGLEFLYARSHGSPPYRLNDVLTNSALALLHQGADGLVSFLVISHIYLWVYEHGLMLFQRDLFGILAVFLLQDFLYYWFHRASHRIGWLWASHVTHHSAEYMNLTAAFRQNPLYLVSGMWVFWMPLAWLGFKPDWIFLAVNLSLAYQFFVHTTVIGKLGVLEWVLNTPSHHRAHHGRNPEYIDHNYGGVLIVWDRMFGTFVEERAPVDYGIIDQVHSNNPLLLISHEWIAMFSAAWRWRDWRYLIKPPEWKHARLQSIAQADNKP